MSKKDILKKLNEILQLSSGDIKDGLEEFIEQLEEDIKSKSKRKSYKLKVEYTIGDTNAYTEEQVTLSLENPFAMLLSNTLDKLKTPEDRRFVTFSQHCFKYNYECHNISKTEYSLLTLINELYYIYDVKNKELAREFSKDFNLDVDTCINYLYEFEGLFKYDEGYSILSYYNHKLKH